MKLFFQCSVYVFLLIQTFDVMPADSKYQTISNEEWRTADNVINFQPFLADAVGFNLQNGGQAYSGKLVNLNYHVNIWYVIRLQPTSNKKRARYFNLENSFPASQSLGMAPDGTLLLIDGDGNSLTCNLFGETDSAHNLLKTTKRNPYVSLCGGKVFLRTQQRGNRNRIKWSKVADDSSMPWDYEDNTVDIAKEYFFGSADRESGANAKAHHQQTETAVAPNNAKMSRQSTIPIYNTRFALAENTGKFLQAGQWYKAKNYDSVYLSLMKPGLIDKTILSSFRDRVAPINRVGGNGTRGSERDAVVTSVAMDLSKYSIGWNNGTKHPGVGWSRRAYGVRKKPRQGPDGFKSLRPQLAFPGVVHPLILPKVVGTFAGGFQRKDSAFKRGPLRDFNKGHHYGFMEKGVLMSTLVPNLATFITYTNGDVDIKTWTKEDNEKLHLVRDARQNGVPLIENGEPSPLVRQWVPGNWFGSAKAELKTLRTSACILNEDGKRYLMISFFSSHTPNALARVLQSYGCNYAMQFDINGLMLTYAAFFQRDDKGGFNIEHLYSPMRTEDVRANGLRAPRSIVTPNYKDFFYVIKR